MPSRKSPCPELQIVDVDSPHKGRKNGEILVSIHGGSGQYEVSLYEVDSSGVNKDPAIVNNKSVTQDSIFAFSGLDVGTYAIRVNDKNRPYPTCLTVEKVVRLDEYSEPCVDTCAKRPSKPSPCADEEPCNVEPLSHHHGKLQCDLHKVVQPTCKRNGYIAVRISGGSGPYEITVKGPVHKTISADRSGVYGTNNLPPGDYCVSVSDSRHECCREEVRLCMVTSPLMINASVVCNPTCSNDGSIQVNICEGTAPYKVFINGPVNITRYVTDAPDETLSPFFNYLPPGNYCVSVIDGDHQVEEVGVYLESQIPQMTIHTSVVKHQVCELESGKIMYTVRNGQFPVRVDLYDGNDMIQCVCHDQENDKTSSVVTGSFDNLPGRSSPGKEYRIEVTDGCYQQKVNTEKIVKKEPKISMMVKEIPRYGKNGTIEVTAIVGDNAEIARCVGPLTFKLEYPNCNPTVTDPDVSPGLIYTKVVPVALNNKTTVTFDHLPPTKIEFSKDCVQFNPFAELKASDDWPDLGYITVTVSAAGCMDEVKSDVKLLFKSDFDVQVSNIQGPTLNRVIDSITNPTGPGATSPAIEWVNNSMADGSATIMIKGGSPPYSVIWSSCGGTHKACVESEDPCQPVSYTLTGLGVNCFDIASNRGARSAMHYMEYLGDVQDRRDVEFEPTPESIDTPRIADAIFKVIDATGAEFTQTFELTEQPLNCSNRRINVTTEENDSCGEVPSGKATFTLTNLTYPLAKFKLSYYGKCPEPGSKTTTDTPSVPSNCQCKPETPGKPGTEEKGKCVCYACDPYFTEFRCVNETPDENNVVTYDVDGLSPGCWRAEIVDCSGCTATCDFSIEETGRVGPTIECEVVNNPTCKKHNGEVKVTVNRDNCPYDHIWVDVIDKINNLTIIRTVPIVFAEGETTTSLNVVDLEEGSYTFNVRDSAGNSNTCETELEAELAENPQLEEPIISQPTCSNNGSIGFNIINVNYPLIATLHGNGFKSTICVDSLPVLDEDDSEVVANPCDTIDVPSTHITFRNLGQGCYTVVFKDICGTKKFSNILLSNCKTPLQASIDGESPFIAAPADVTFKYEGGNGRILAQLSGPSCSRKVYPATQCGEEVNQTITGLPEGAYSLTLTDQCNQRCTLHFQVGESTDNGGIGCCPPTDLSKLCTSVKKGPFDVYLIKVDDC